MYYEINVSYNNQHFFATAERSIVNEEELKRVYKVIKEKFPESDGYRITVTHWEKRGEIIMED